MAQTGRQIIGGLRYAKALPSLAFDDDRTTATNWSEPLDAPEFMPAGSTQTLPTDSPTYKPRAPSLFQRGVPWI